ncbi:MAG TPA: tRNA preQ1(34) S-adenosylmethionine ribosyltransferase-isomerase QueA, partial [Trinickia sp.]|nr:tRNA preQ1(34) S-adenosylmethionine ribosyltransferase-isomerase QueA [Trinickia sp.]
TRVLAARLYGRKETGGAVEILIERLLGAHEALAQLGVSKKPREGSRIVLGDGSTIRVLGREGEFYTLRFESAEPLEKLLVRLGRMPLPPYIARPAGDDDETRYQTVYARKPGAVAAPTAGLHFDRPLLDVLRAHGVDFGYVTLHVGAGTFQPVRKDRLEEHVMHREWLNVGAELIEKMRRARARGGRVIAVGTTSMRALEAAAREAEAQGRPLAATSAETDIFITPGYRFRVVDRLVTNFHLPKSTLLMLVSAFAGVETIRSAYRHAIEERYRFFSYGDAMLLTRREGA